MPDTERVGSACTEGFFVPEKALRVERCSSGYEGLASVEAGMELVEAGGLLVGPGEGG